MIVVYYSEDNGRAYQVLQAPDLGGFPEAPPGCLALLLTSSVKLPGYVDGTTYVPLPPSPSDNYEFNWVTKQWEDPRTILDFKQAKWEEVKAARDAKEFGTFDWNGYVFDGDQEAQRRLNLAVLGAQQALAIGNAGWTIEWTLANNQLLSLTASDLVGVVSALGQNIAQAHEEARIKRALIDAALTQEQLEAI